MLHRHLLSRSALRSGLVLMLAMIGLVMGSSGCRDRETTDDEAQAPPRYEEIASAFHTGVAAMQVGQLDEAEKQLLRAADLAPDEPSIHVNLGLLHLRRGDADGAADQLERARALAPSSGEVALYQGHVEGLRGRLEEAAAHLRRSLDENHDDARPAFELARVLERIGGDEAEREIQQRLEAILENRPDNLAVLVERSRAAVRRGDFETLRDSLSRMEGEVDSWPSGAQTQYRALANAARDENTTEAGRSVAFLRNLIAQMPAFRESRRGIDISAESAVRPLEHFLALKTPDRAPDAPDASLSFSLEQLDADPTVTALLPVWSTTGPPTVYLAARDGLRRTSSEYPAIPFPAGDVATPSPRALVALDWNHDFATDVAVADAAGVRLHPADGEGRFGAPTSVTDAQSSGIWAADIEMDGDLDLVVARTGGSPIVARNNGDGTIRLIEAFSTVSGLRGFAWGDLDLDGDPDAALLDASGRLHVFANERAGRFRPMPVPTRARRIVAITIADADSDGSFEVLALDEGGGIQRVPFGPGPDAAVEIAAWHEIPAKLEVGAARLAVADLDNNGALDLVASSSGRSKIWLADETLAMKPFGFDGTGEVEVLFAADMTSDGRLDLVGLSSSGQPVVLVNRGVADYHWQILRARAREEPGDQRINSFGVGGEMEIRSGLLTQKQLLTGAPLHFGLGVRRAVDVARVVWPNGVQQAEFALNADQVVEVEQRLKGSCPWVFAYDGERMRFVTDFIWRSPLGLRINAQDTAGILQTEDWVKIRGDQLVPKDGVYGVRITAELWETHFFDHVSLMTVDHPAALEVFVDERFAREPPSLEIHVTGPPHPVAHARDDTGRDVSDLIRERDGRHAGTFERGRYQGVASEHVIEIDLGEEPPRDEPVWLLAHGFVYPTDSSINVAMGQGDQPAPHGIAVEVPGRDGEWVVTHPDLGFPSGKNKTIMIDLKDVFPPDGERRVRLRTNLEVYWDWIGWSVQVEKPTIQTTRIAPSKAVLRYRGFSETNLGERHAPEIPDYEHISNTTQRWRDLVGYYTRFGDVRELLASIDDRYVIMNAGDEMAFEFPAPPPARDGWVRDFVLIGDGWVKDGDYNTAFSRTVGPLPSHDEPEYSGDPDLELDPVYRRNRRDWEIYHTRFVGTDSFARGLQAGDRRGDP